MSADFEETAGVNDRAELAACARVLQERINPRTCAPASPCTTRRRTIEAEVTLGADTVLEPNVSLRREDARSARA